MYYVPGIGNKELGKLYTVKEAVNECKLSRVWKPPSQRHTTVRGIPQTLLLSLPSSSQGLPPAAWPSPPADTYSFTWNTGEEPGHLWRVEDPVKKHTGGEEDPQTSSQGWC